MRVGLIRAGCNSRKTARVFISTIRLGSTSPRNTGARRARSWHKRCGISGNRTIRRARKSGNRPAKSLAAALRLDGSTKADSRHRPGWHGARSAMSRERTKTMNCDKCGGKLNESGKHEHTSYVECAYCRSEYLCDGTERIPTTESEWEEEAKKHSSDCEWLITRAHQN